MSYVKTHWHALLIGGVVVYLLQRNGGIHGAVAKAKSVAS